MGLPKQFHNNGMINCYNHDNWVGTDFTDLTRS